MSFTCVLLTNCAADRKARAAGTAHTVPAETLWPVAKDMVGSSLMRSPDGINFFSIAELYKNFSSDRTWEQTNLLTPILSQVREKKKVKMHEESNVMALRSVQKRKGEEDVLQELELKYFCKLW